MSNPDSSPTLALHSTTPSSSTPTMPPKSLTLILAATPSLGIGQSGGLPWPQLKKEMGYFARVTKRTTPKRISEGNTTGRSLERERRINAVIMGRKTWDSIPAKFRPLQGRINVVITRHADGLKSYLPEKTSEQREEGPLIAGSVADALAQLQGDEVGVEVDKVMVIGGASIYEQALKLSEAKHVLLTKIQKDYDCDTFFSEDLDGDRWIKASETELKAFTGENFEGGTEIEEKDVRFEFCLYNRIE